MEIELEHEGLDSSGQGRDLEEVQQFVFKHTVNGEWVFDPHQTPRTAYLCFTTGLKSTASDILIFDEMYT